MDHRYKNIDILSYFIMVYYNTLLIYNTICVQYLFVYISITGDSNPRNQIGPGT